MHIMFLKRAMLDDAPWTWQYRCVVEQRVLLLCAARRGIQNAKAQNVSSLSGGHPQCGVVEVILNLVL